MSAAAREQAFLRDLQAVVNLHRAEITVTDDGKPYGLHAGRAGVTLEAGDGEEFAEFDLPSFITHDPKWVAPTCRWSEDEDGNWDSECDQTWCLTDGTPSENDMRFCHGCGLPIVEARYAEPDSERDE